MRTCTSLATTAAAGAVMLAPQAALAHAGHGEAGSLVSGLTHPIFGLDHLLAMVASGLLAVRAGSKAARWAVPATFVGLMAAGGGLAAAGAALPVAEWGIALSVIVLGLLVAVAPRVPLGVAAGLVGLFAVCHGYAHVAEVGGHALLPYAAGFLLMTAALHAAAIAVGVQLSQRVSPVAVQTMGGAVTAAFCLLLVVG